MDLSGLQRTSEAATPEQPVYTAQVVRADTSGLWVVPLGEDIRNPVGPCRGGWTANGGRVPPGNLVALMMTDDGPWAIAYDDARLATADDFAPFQNPSFEEFNISPEYGTERPNGWSTFWSDGSQQDPNLPIATDKWARTSDPAVSMHGTRSVRVDANNTYPGLESHEWIVPAGASIEISCYARGIGVEPMLQFSLWTNIAANYAGPFGGGAGIQETGRFTLTDEWVRYRAVFTLPPTHSKANLFLRIGSKPGSGGIATVWADNVDADVVTLDPASVHQEFMRRAALVIAGGGSRLVTAGGNVAWSQPFTIAGIGRELGEAPAGRFEIAMPTNGTLIPVHSSGTRVSHTVAGGVIALDPDDALWYELPIGEAAASQPARFHILAGGADDGFVVPPHWMLVVRRTAWSATQHAPEYRWGDSRQQDPWRTPSFNAGWIDGTTAGRYSKTGEGMIVMRGRVRNGAGSAFTLPAGYRPAVQHEAYVRDGAGTPALLTITTAGVVTTAGNNTDHSIATAFPAAEQ